MAKYLETNLKTGSAKAEKPMSHATDGPAGGGHPGKYHPAGAAAHLKEQDTCIPHNDGPMKKAIGSKSIA